MTVNILGTDYTILKKSKNEDSHLNNYDGYCDKTTHVIVVITKDSDCDLGNFDEYQKKILRHEIIHAFLFESGLHENWSHEQFGHDETYVDWIAAQFPKMLKVFQIVGCI